MFFSFAMSSAVQRRNVGLGICTSQLRIETIKMLRFLKSSATELKLPVLRCGTFRMPRTSWTSYLVVDCFGRLGTTYRETDIERTDLETVITDMMSGQFNDPVRIIAFARMTPTIPRGTVMGERIGRPPLTEAEHFQKCEACGGCLDVRSRCGARP
jgi:hypothetical protein